MTARQVKQTAKEWVAANIPSWPGIRGAHLVGAVTTMPEDALFPLHKDVDVHLIFEPDSPLLKPIGPFPNHLEVPYQGLSIEGGLKSVDDYLSAEVLLANPTIAHHLTVDSALLFDPGDWLKGLQTVIRSEYPRRKWVLARVEYERRKQKEILVQREMARTMSGTAGEMGVLGYSHTCIPALLSIVTLRAPTTGSRALLRVREVVSEYNRPDLYEELLSVLGVSHFRPDQVVRRLQEGAEAFDLAVVVRRSPHPFQHKLQRHLRPYFIESCRSLLADGYHREAALWLIAFFMSSIDVILADGPDVEKPRFLARRGELMHDMGVDTEAAVSARFEQAFRLYDEFFTLAGEIASRHPGIVN